LGKQLRENNKEQNKSDGGAHWRTEAYKLFRSIFFLPQSTTLMRNQHLCNVIIIAVKGA